MKRRTGIKPYHVIAGPIVWGAVCVVSLVYLMRTFAPIVKPVAAMFVPRPHNEHCANLADLAEKHMGSFISRNRLVERLYGYGMGTCDPSAPNVRYLFLGRYRFRESRRSFVEDVMEPLAHDGWKLGSVSNDGPTASLRTGGFTLTATQQYTGSDAAPNYHIATTPELFDITITANRIVGAAGTTPEFGGRIAQSMLDQMTLFSPSPLPTGIRSDPTDHTDVIDYGFFEFSVLDGLGRGARVQERPAPSIVRSNCDVFGSTYVPAPHAAPNCPTIATSRRGRPIYVAFARRAGDADWYGLVDGDTAISIVWAFRHHPQFDRAETIELIDSLAPTNSSRKRL